VVTLVQLLRLRDPKLLALLVLFAGQALAFSRDWRDPLQDVFQIVSGAAGLGLVVLVSRRSGTRH
jgi:type IV secretory pathway VirB2 component (pilin)